MANGSIGISVLQRFGILLGALSSPAHDYRDTHGIILASGAGPIANFKYRHLKME